MRYYTYWLPSWWYNPRKRFVKSKEVYIICLYWWFDAKMSLTLTVKAHRKKSLLMWCRRKSYEHRNNKSRIHKLHLSLKYGIMHKCTHKIIGPLTGKIINRLSQVQKYPFCCLCRRSVYTCTNVYHQFSWQM